MQTNEKLYWVWLSSVAGIGARRFYKLLEAFNDPKNVFEAKKSDEILFKRILGQKLAQNLIQSSNDEALDKARKTMEMPGISILTLQSPEYPPLLKAIYDPPAILYTKGQPLDTVSSSIAIVGARRSSDYGRMSAKKLASELAESGVTIVSGMARGIDTFAHKGTLEVESGYTVAVLGCGVNYVYPPENKDLYKKILERGTIVSEYPPESIPTPGNFPARNRIISGLASGTLVIEAGVKSGALITVDYALEQGRDVYALPGNFNSPFSKGTNKLLKDGAKVITGVDDILEDLDIENRLSRQTSKAVVLDFFETQVYNALETGEKGVEELLQLTGLDSGRLNAVLTLMELKGIIKKLPGNIFTVQWKD
ncbi:MAG TPA: DNA-processing protein DprA [Bacillota bacterium]|nr:DNA-processing protein DprA [Bacillota bacterium]